MGGENISAMVNGTAGMMNNERSTERRQCAGAPIVASCAGFRVSDDRWTGGLSGNHRRSSGAAQLPEWAAKVPG